ncbi:MAG: DUF3365 domain-containing protein [Proteobacteria bacterium]|nr:DUF3365 domain-containing protein [Pseudomonadota bacterium]
MNSIKYKLGGVFAVLSILTAGLVMATFVVTRAQSDDGVVINLAGRQRMLSQRITKATLGYAIELGEREEAAKIVELIVATRGHLASTISDSIQTNDFTVNEETLNFTPAAAARAIAAKFSRNNRLTLRQISNKYRNIANKSDAYESEILSKMAAAPDVWKDKVHAEKVINGDSATMRYIRPLFVKKACLSCHGSPQTVPEFITKKYPDDLATGFREGELRGAVSVQWPTRKQNIEEHNKEVSVAINLFDDSLGVLQRGGSVDLGGVKATLSPTDSQEIIAQLRIVADIWSRFKKSVETILMEDNARSDKYLAALNHVMSENTLLLAEMNKAVKLYENDSNSRVSRLQTILLVFLFITIVVVTIALVYTNRSIVNPIKGVANYLSSVANGDLTIRDLGAKSNDEVGTLTTSTNEMVRNLATAQEKMKNTQIDVQGSARGVSDVVAEIAPVSGDLKEKSNNIASQTNNISAAAEELKSTMETVAESAQTSQESITTVAAATEEMTTTVNEIAQNAERARGVADNAVRSVSSASSKVDELGEAAKEISLVTETIVEIADQTKLLALNATIEAARAGEAGKGFAVVASEVKDLAKQTNDATIDIREKIEAIQSSAERTIAEIVAITDVINEVNDFVSTIATATEEQSITTKDIAGNITYVSDGITNMANNVSQAADVTREVTTSINAVSVDISDVDATASSLSNTISTLQQTGNDLTEMVDRLGQD